MILLDTHVVIWAVDDSPRLGARARASIAGDDDRRVSAMVAWEIAMLVDRGRLVLGLPLDTWVERSLASLAARDVPVSRAIALEAGRLGNGLHGDPCDRLMVATARALDAALITADEHILRYAAAGHVRAIDARG